MISSTVSTAESAADAAADAVDSSVATNAPVFHGLTKTGHTLADMALDALDDLKAEQMVTFDLRGRSNVCDFMIIVSGRSNTHVGSLADNLGKELTKNKCEILRVAGTEHRDWVVFDANNVVVHIFRPEVRAFYQLEKMWDPSFQVSDPNENPAGALNSAPML